MKTNKEIWVCRRHGKKIVTNFSNLDKDFVINNIEAKNFRFGRECNCTPPQIFHSMNRELFDDLFTTFNPETFEKRVRGDK